MSSGPMWSSLCPLMWRQLHWIGDSSSRSGLIFFLNVVSLVISILMTSIPPQAAVIFPSVTLYFFQIFSIIMTQ